MTDTPEALPARPTKFEVAGAAGVILGISVPDVEPKLFGLRRECCSSDPSRDGSKREREQTGAAFAQSGALWRPIAASTCHTTFCALAFEIAWCLRELRPVDIVKGVDIHDRISSTLDHTRHDRNNSTRLTHMEIGRLGSESVLARLGSIGNCQPKPASGMRCPNTPVFPTVSTATRPDRDCVPGTGPIERKSDVAAVTASVDLSERGLVRHGNVRE